MEFETKGKQVNVHYVNIPVPNVVEEISGGYSEEDFALAMALQEQELQGDFESYLSGDTSSVFDEAFARKLQELENQLSDTSIGGNAKAETNVNSAKSSVANADHNSASTSQVVEEDDIDPDSMSYEELQRLGEAIGTESKGLSDELISYLSTYTYKTGLFSKKGKHEECVICCMAYKKRDVLLVLPCQHQYHKPCVSKWLKINKACPICNEEVFGS